MPKEKEETKKKEKKEKKEEKKEEVPEKKEKKEKKARKATRTESAEEVPSAEKETKKKEKKEKKKEEEEKEEGKEEEKVEAKDVPKSEASSETESSATEIPKIDDEEAELEADDILLGEAENLEELNKKKNAVLKENKRVKQMKKLKSKRAFADAEDDQEPWFAMRNCLFLVLESRMLLKEMIALKLKQQRMARGDLGVNEIQNLIKSQKEEQETDWIAEIQELKRNLISEVRKNHVKERDLNKLDKRIALLIKNRGNIQEVLAAAHGAKKAKTTSDKSQIEITADPRKLESYQNLFYLIQTEPKYLANLVYLMKNEHMESFLDTVILTLYGDAFSPREEYLTLKLFQLAVQKEMSAIKKVSDFVKADSVVPKMLATYNRRKQGLDFLKAILTSPMKEFYAQELNLELKPSVVYQQMISDEEIKTGEKSVLKRDLSEDEIMQVKEVKEIMDARVAQLLSFCEKFFTCIIKGLNKLPYGIRWICKQIRGIAQENFEGIGEDDILKVTGYFVYYRFMNVAITSPQAFEIIDTNPTQVSTKNLVAIGKVLQNLFNFSLFSSKNDRWMVPLNPWLEKNFPIVRDYFTDLIEVADPEEYLQVDKYMELTQKTKPVIIISLHEIAQTHLFLKENLDKLAKDKEDPLRLIMNDLGDSPNVPKEDDREIQLTLTNRFKQNMEEDISASASLYAETKELIISTFRLIPVQGKDQDQTLLGILNAGKKFAEEKKNTQLVTQIDKILENIKALETEGLITKSDNYASFLRDIALEVANRAEIREQQRKEIKRLTQTLRNLRKHQKYLDDQIKQYNDYLQDCRLKHYQPKKKKKKKTGADPNKIGPFKFSYSALAKKGVIIDSEVPQLSRKRTNFFISSEAVGVFDIVAKVSGFPVETMTIELDDLLERNYNNVTRLELEQVVLDVNMTIHLINKFFLN